MTKVDIVSGFLGAGKTTFIKQMIEKVYKDEKLVLIENEFGEIGIDGGFLKNAGIEITEMNSGCICCTLVGDFTEALKKVIDEYHPDRIIIEPSGVGKLSDVEKAVRKVEDADGLEIEHKIAVVNAKKAKMYRKNFGEFFQDQVEYASVIVLSRTQTTDEKKLAECIETMKEDNPSAVLITTDWDSLSSEALTAAMKVTEDMKDAMLKEVEEHHHAHDHEEHDHEHCHHDHEEHNHEHCHHDHEEHDHEHCDHDHEGHDHHDHCGCGHDHHHHHADEVFTSWGLETVHKFDKTALDALLKDLANTDKYGAVLRAKGIVAGSDGIWMEFDLVPEEYEIRTCDPNYTGKLCVIGQDLKEDEIKAAFLN